MNEEQDQKIENIFEMPDTFSMLPTNCTYATSSGIQAKISINALFKIMEDIPKSPRILTMDLQLKEASILPDNTIIISSDIARAIEEALKG